MGFNTQPPEGGCEWTETRAVGAKLFQHTAARRRLRRNAPQPHYTHIVSTHSRPKAAALNKIRIAVKVYSFNTQPPEGGCTLARQCKMRIKSFNTQPPEGGCTETGVNNTPTLIVSTHSRPKAAACHHEVHQNHHIVSTHSRPKAAASVF